APVPRFAEVTDVVDIDAFAERVGTDIVVKTVRGGYDGRGVTLAGGIAEARAVAGRDLAGGAAGVGGGEKAIRRGRAGLGGGRPGQRSGRARHGRWCRPCRATASASRSSRPRRN